MPGDNKSVTYEVVPRLRGDAPPNTHAIYTANFDFLSIDEFSWEDVQGLINRSGIGDSEFLAYFDELQQSVGYSGAEFAAMLGRNLPLVNHSVDKATVVREAINREFRLVRASSGNAIAGRLITPTFSDPIANQTIRATAEDGTLYQSRTYQDGSFIFVDLPSGNYSLSRATAFGNLDESQEVVVSDDAPTLDVVVEALVLPASAEINVTTDGAPKLNADLLLYKNSELVYAETLTEGTASIDGLVPGEYHAVARADGFAATSMSFFVGPEGESVARSIELRPGGSISGRVEAPGAIPVRGVVVVSSSGVDPTFRPILMDLASNEFVVDSIPAGNVNVSILIEGYAPIAINEVEISDKGMVILESVSLTLESNQFPEQDIQTVTSDEFSSNPEWWFIVWKNFLDGVFYTTAPYLSPPTTDVAWAKFLTNSDLFHSWYRMRVDTLFLVFWGSQLSLTDSLGDGVGLAIDYYTEYFDALEPVGTKAIPDGSDAQRHFQYLSRSQIEQSFGTAFEIVNSDPFWQRHFECDENGVTKRYSVDDLEATFAARGGTDVFHAKGAKAPLGNNSRRWNYPGRGPGGILAGGNGSFGDDPDFDGSGTVSDEREIRGDVIATRERGSSVVKVKTQWDFKVLDAVDFWPGNTRLPIIGWNYLADLVPLEQNGMTWDVPFVSTYEVETITDEFTVSADGDCDCPPPPPACVNGEVNPAYTAWVREWFGSNAQSTADCGSFDPNDIIGPGGVGDQNWIRQSELLPYTIRFENDARKASAPAASVRVAQTLDADLDFSTFEIGQIGFGDLVLGDTTGKSSFQTRLNFTEELGVLLDIKAGIDVTTGEVVFELASVDPETGEVPFNPLLGFLPPNLDGSEGQGFLTYTIQPKSDVVTGDVIDAVAEIIFDQNEAIETPPIFNSIDADGPMSHVLPLGLNSYPGVLVSWEGEDSGSGVRDYDVYLAKDGGAPEIWLEGFRDTQARFINAEPGSAYAFFSVATDAVGHRELFPGQPDAMTSILAPAEIESVSADDSGLSLQIRFTKAPDLQPLIADGTIGEHISIHLTTGENILLDPLTFQYSEEFDSLMLSWSNALPEGDYKLAFDSTEIWSLARDLPEQPFSITAPNPHPWQNPLNPVDVNGDGIASPRDALMIINRLARSADNELHGVPIEATFYDTNGDDLVTPRDALLVINRIAIEQQGEFGFNTEVSSEGVSHQNEQPSTAPLNQDWLDDEADERWVQLLAEEQAVL
ncbi:MAG: hypothetical protein F9B45_15180 [Phycisphaera sp. RhM]|nr:hypothetical protein [Phycisphaera sp. RhM]